MDVRRDDLPRLETPRLRVVPLVTVSPTTSIESPLFGPEVIVIFPRLNHAMGIDELMDMARTSVNVTGNCLATAVIARWEGELDDQKMHDSDKVVEEPAATEV